jgi:putative transposase
MTVSVRPPRRSTVSLIEAELTSVIGAVLHQRIPDRLGLAQRNGHRPRVLAITAGDLELRIPTLRAGSFFSSLLEHRRRSIKRCLRW